MTDSNIAIEKIDPERAQGMLARNRHNRSVSATYVRNIAGDMAAGNWKLNGEAIKFAKDGTLLDGQHRLAAIVQSGATIETYVVYGLDHADQETMDAGRKRTLSDILALRGEENASHLAAAIGVYWRRQHGQVYNNAHPTNHQALSVLVEHPDLRYSVTAVRKTVKALRFPWGLAAALHYEMNTLNGDDADDFWAKLASGLGLHGKHPIYVLRRRLEENAVTVGRKLDRIMIHAYTIKAWNAYREGREITILRWTRGGASPESFPELT